MEKSLQIFPDWDKNRIEFCIVSLKNTIIDISMHLKQNMRQLHLTLQALEERLARRKQLAEMHRFQKEQQSNEIEVS